MLLPSMKLLSPNFWVGFSMFSKRSKDLRQDLFYLLCLGILITCIFEIISKSWYWIRSVLYNSDLRMSHLMSIQPRRANDHMFYVFGRLPRPSSFQWFVKNVLKNVLLTVVIYYSERQTKISYRKIHVGEGPGEPDSRSRSPLPVESCGQCLIPPVMMNDNVHGVLPNRKGNSPKHWCLGILMKVIHERMANYLHWWPSVSIPSRGQAENKGAKASTMDHILMINHMYDPIQVKYFPSRQDIPRV